MRSRRRSGGTTSRGTSRELLPIIRVGGRGDGSGSRSGKRSGLTRQGRTEEATIEKAVASVRRRPQDMSKIMGRAEAIVRGVRERGDDALIAYSRELDGVSSYVYEDSSGKSSTRTPKRLQVGNEEVAAAEGRVSPALMDAMRFALKRIQRTQGQLLQRIPFSYVSEGFVIKSVLHPLDSVGCYIPGGKASYASTVLMTAGVAKQAGVKRVIICSPPGADGRVGDGILAAAKLCGVDAVYRVGGAQAIAAMAYGTESVGRVSKIVGPGGLYVSAAKKLVSADVPIDFFAGPTEMVVLADGREADPRLVAWDLMAQAEHGPDGICCLVTWDEGLAEEVRAAVARVSPTLARSGFVQETLSKGAAFLCSDRETAIEVVRALAPEHLELMVEDAAEVAASIDDAGLILTGRYAPGAASDYCIGTDHVIPTEGGARLRAGLTALDFVKVNWVVEGTREGLRSLLPSLKELALAEGLPNHFLSVQSRFRRRD
jgi:histidinol dehydrogenase